MKLSTNRKSFVLTVRLIIPAVIVLMSTLASNRAAIAITASWVTDTPGALWHQSTNWDGGVVPEFGDVALIGNTVVAENSHVRIDQLVFISDLSLTDGMDLLNIDFGGEINPITVVGDTVVQDGNITNVTHFPAVRLFRGPSGYDFYTNNLHLESTGNLDLRGGAITVIGNTLTNTSSGFIEGQGVINFSGGGTTLINDGKIDPKGAIGLTLNQLGGGLYDLDGTSGDGRLDIDGSGIFAGEGLDRMTINGVGLADSFSGSIFLSTGRRLNMNLSSGWTADSNSVITVRPSATASGPALIQGGHLTLAGDLELPENFSSWIAWARVEAATTIGGTASVLLEPEAILSFDDQTTIEGGAFTLAEDAALDFDGPTTLEGGTFNTFSQLSSQGSVQFNGETDWDGNVTISGIARQNGDADVVGPTTIQAGVLDMDGGGGTIWNVGSGLVINAAGVDSTISNSFDGVLNVGGGFAPKLTINLSDPADHWTMAGEMNLSNLGFVPFPVARVAGSLMRVTGQLNVSHLVGITAPTTFDNNSETNLLANTDRLTMSGPTTVRPGAMFNGVGTLVNVSDAGMTLEDGVSLDDVRLINGGLLEIGDSPGVASVDRFENTDAGTWLVEIGGHIAGTEHDLLIVTDGIAQLDGFLNVDLIDAGVGLFLPEVGDQFTVLTSLGDVSGAFTNDPVSFAAGQQFHWDVVYDPHNVILELANITVPEPMSLMLLVCGITVCGWHLRCRRSDGRLVCRRC